MVKRARGKATSSEIREIAYACFVMVLDPSPPTTYHGQESARGGHTGSYSKAMFDMSRIVCELEKNSAKGERKRIGQYAYSRTVCGRWYYQVIVKRDALELM